MEITRREALLGLAGSGLAVGLLAGCGGDDDPAPPPDSGALPPDTGAPQHDQGGGSTCTTTGTAVDIGTNHGHALTVSKEDVIAGTERSYDIKGSSSHAHQVTLSVADFAKLQAGESVTVTSSDGSEHTHEVTVSCA